MLAGRQITVRPQITCSEFEPKYLRTSIALWVDGGSQETQYSVLSTRYSVHSVFSSWYSVLNTQEHCLAAVQCVVACCCCCCLFDHLWRLQGAQTAQRALLCDNDDTENEELQTLMRARSSEDDCICLGYQAFITGTDAFLSFPELSLAFLNFP